MYTFVFAPAVGKTFAHRHDLALSVEDIVRDVLPYDSHKSRIPAMTFVYHVLVNTFNQQEQFGSLSVLVPASLVGEVEGDVVGVTRVTLGDADVARCGMETVEVSGSKDPWPTTQTVPVRSRLDSDVANASYSKPFDFLVASSADTRVVSNGYTRLMRDEYVQFAEVHSDTLQQAKEVAYAAAALWTRIAIYGFRATDRFISIEDSICGSAVAIVKNAVVDGPYISGSTIYIPVATPIERLASFAIRLGALNNGAYPVFCSLLRYSLPIMKRSYWGRRIKTLESYVELMNDTRDEQ